MKYSPKVSFKDAATVNMPRLMVSTGEFDTKGTIVIVPVHVFLSLLERSVKNL